MAEVLTVPAQAPVSGSRIPDTSPALINTPMAVALDKPHQWKADVAKSVDMYNDWFMRFAPQAFRTTRVQATKDVEAALHASGDLTDIKAALLREHPEILPTLRMATCPPLAVDRLIGLAGVSPSMVKRMEDEQKLPARMSEAEVARETLLGNGPERVQEPAPGRDVQRCLRRKAA